MKIIFIVTFLLTAAVFGNAYYQERHFYPMLVHILKSSPSVSVIFMQIILLVFLAGKYLGRLFFGEITSYEVELLLDRTTHFLTDSGFAFATFRSETANGPRLGFMLTNFFFMKCAHTLAEERVDLLERSPVIPLKSHVRMVSLIFTLIAIDFMSIKCAIDNAATKGHGWYVAFVLEYSILIIAALNFAMRYALNSCEMFRFVNQETKTAFFHYAEILSGVFQISLYSCCGLLIVVNQGAPFFAVRPIFSAYHSIKRAMRSLILSKRAVRIMNRLFPTATAEDIAAFENVCVICREDLENGEESKKLPCRHIFHTPCLRMWFQRQQNCPTCRLDVLNVYNEPNVNTQNNENVANNNNHPEGPNPFSPGNSDTHINNINSFGEIHRFIRDTINQLQIPDDDAGLSEDQIKRMADISKEILQERIEALTNIQQFVDSSLTVLNRYMEVVNRFSDENISPTNSEKPPEEPNTNSSDIKYDLGQIQEVNNES